MSNIIANNTDITKPLKDVKKPIKKKKRAQSSAESIAALVLDKSGIIDKSRFYDFFVFPSVGDILYDTPAHVIENAVKGKITEKSLFSAIKHNKKFKNAIDKYIKDMAIDILTTSNSQYKEILVDNKFAAAEQKKDAKDKLLDQKLQEQEEKEKVKIEAEKELLRKSITKKQKRAIAKLYGANIDTE